MSVTSHGQLTAVPIAVQGNNVSIVPGNMNTQFIAKATHQAIRPAGATGQIMLQVSSPLIFKCHYKPEYTLISYLQFEITSLYFENDRFI